MAPLLRTFAILLLCLARLSGAAEGDLDLSFVRPKVPPPATETPAQPVKHPSILIPSGGIAELQTRARTTHQRFAERIVAMANKIIAEDVNTAPKNNESTMRQELRKPGQLAWAFAATGDVKYRDAAIRWALACCKYPHWDIDVDLACGHALVSMAQVFDWFNLDLSAEQRKAILEKVRHEGQLMDASFGPAKVVGGTWWTKAYLQNHGAINCVGLFAAGFVFRDEIPEAATWQKHAEGYLDHVFAVLDEDGSSMEGINYWAYGVENLMLYAELAKSVTGRDFFTSCGYFRNAGQFLTAHLTPWIRTEDYAIPFGAPELSAGVHGPSHILYKCAAITRDSRVQDLADLLWKAKINEGSYMLPYCLLWCDPTVATQPAYTQSPSLFAFPEMGIATARSGWSEDATLLWFKCGPFQGRAATEDVGSAHCQPDQTSLQLIGRGERLTAYGNGTCVNQSMILFRGKAQEGEPPAGKEERGSVIAAMFKVKEQPALLKVHGSSGVDYMAGDAGHIYLPEAGVERYRRHVIFMKPDDVIVVDEIKLAKRGEAQHGSAPDVEWNLQVLGQPKRIDAENFAVEGRTAALDVQLCLPAEGFELAASDPPPNKGYMVPEIFWARKRLSIRSTTPVTETLLVTRLHVRGHDDAPGAKATAHLDGRKLSVELPGRSGNRTVELDLDELICRTRD